MNRLNRMVFGGLIGWLAGFSFMTALLPFVMEMMIARLPPDLFYAIAQYALPFTVLWIPVGSAAALYGGWCRGGQIFGAGALIVSGLFGFLIGQGSGAWFVPVVSALLGGLYGLGAGMLVGGGFGAASK